MSLLTTPQECANSVFVFVDLRHVILAMRVSKELKRYILNYIDYVHDMAGAGLLRPLLYAKYAVKASKYGATGPVQHLCVYGAAYCKCGDLSIQTMRFSMDISSEFNVTGCKKCYREYACDDCTTYTTSDLKWAHRCPNVVPGVEDMCCWKMVCADDCSWSCCECGFTMDNKDIYAPDEDYFGVGDSNGNKYKNILTKSTDDKDKLTAMYLKYDNEQIKQIMCYDCSSTIRSSCEPEYIDLRTWVYLN